MQALEYRLGKTDRCLPSTIAKKALEAWCQTYHRTGTFL